MSFKMFPDPQELTPSSCTCYIYYLSWWKNNWILPFNSLCGERSAYITIHSWDTLFISLIPSIINHHHILQIKKSVDGQNRTRSLVFFKCLKIFSVVLKCGSFVQEWNSEPSTRASNFKLLSMKVSIILGSHNMKLF